MGTPRFCVALAAVVVSSIVSSFAARPTFAAAQLKAGAATSAQPTAPKHSELRQIQILFDPATFAAVSTGPGATAAPPNPIDLTRAIDAFQLTVGYNSSQVTLVNQNAPDYRNTNFGPPTPGELFYPALYGPYSPFVRPGFSTALFTPTPLTTGVPAGFDTFVTAGGSIAGPLVPGDVNIFSLLFNVDPSVANSDLVDFAIFASPHNADGTPLHPDFIESVSLGDPNNPDFMSNGPGTVETTIIGVSPGGDFVTIAGNSALPAGPIVVPLPRAATAALGGLALAAAFQMRHRRKPLGR